MSFRRWQKLIAARMPMAVPAAAPTVSAPPALLGPAAASLAGALLGTSAESFNRVSRATAPRGQARGDTLPHSAREAHLSNGAPLGSECQGGGGRPGASLTGQAAALRSAVRNGCRRCAA